VFLTLKQYDQALAAFNKAISLDSSNAVYHDNQGQALYELNRYQEALAAYDQAIELAPTNAAYQSNREAAQRALNQSSEAAQNANASGDAPPLALAQPPGSGTIALPTSPPTQAATARAGFQTFTSSDNSFRLVYPGEWQLQADLDGTGATFTSPDKQHVFTVRATNPGTAPADPAAVVVAACSKAGGVLSSLRTVWISGQPWKQMNCDASGGSSHLAAQAVLYQGKVFFMSYASPKGSFESTARQFFTPMEQSFQFLS
jgi:tetratricopeptide (TPR) repeat protein